MSIQKLSPHGYSNTHVERTEESGLRPLVDWAEVTLVFFKNPKEILQFFGLNIDDFTELENGQDGYRKTLKFGGIRLLYGGKEDNQMKMIFTGQGCREYETMNIMDWTTFFALLLNVDKLKINRLDLALDDFEGHFTLNTIKGKVREGAVKSRFRTARDMRKTELATGDSLGDTVYFGSPKSDLQIRMYDKKLERESQGKEIESDVKSWVRTEIQLRRHLALSTACVIALQSESIGTVISRILKNYISFLVVNKLDSNKRRWKVCKWWEKFVGDVEPLHLSQKAPDRTIEKAYAWLDKSVAPTLAMMYEAFEGDMTIFHDLIVEGTNRLDKKHEIMLTQFEKHFNNISFRDFKNKKFTQKNDDSSQSSSEKK